MPNYSKTLRPHAYTNNKVSSGVVSERKRQKIYNAFMMQLTSCYNSIQAENCNNIKHVTFKIFNKCLCQCFLGMGTIQYSLPYLLSGGE